MRSVSLLLIFILLAFSCLQAQRKKILIDADTANELDDVIAIVRALQAPELEVVGLTAAQWKHLYSYQLQTADSSHILNEQVLKLMDRTDIPAAPGSEVMIGKPWGGTNPVASPASKLIIDQAMAMPEGEKLMVVCLGAFTNVASAVQIEPAIIPRLSLYLIGARYHLDKMAWDKNEYNVRNDMNAFDVLLNTPELELSLMPANVSEPLRFELETAERYWMDKPGIRNYMMDRWQAVAKDRPTWIMWDLALIEAIIHPELATLKQVPTPPENLHRMVSIYTDIDEGRMEADFWATQPE